MSKDIRRDPNALLTYANKTEQGQLTIFLGAAAGVGKTYAMLKAAQEKIAEGKDLVIGWVETHGRIETETLLQGLPLVEPKQLDYQGRTFPEMDLDAILARHPQIVLVDELAHTNMFGSRHPKRYVDVEELLAAGINVYTTVNIQHLESLNDTVAQITGVTVRETVPDSFLERADQIHLVDIPAEELLKRLAEGKVYTPEMASKAIKKFFRPGNINALREILLRYAADRVDKQLEDYRKMHGIEVLWPAAERVMACVSSSPFGIHVLRRARLMAANLKAEFLVAYVEAGGGYSRSSQASERLNANLRLAQELGAKIIMMTNPNIAEGILEAARTHNVTQIVLGKPLRPHWREVISGSLTEKIIRGSTGISVHIIPGTPENNGTSSVQTRTAPLSNNMGGYLQTGLLVILLSILAWLMRNGLGLTNIAMLFLLPVLYASARLGIGPSLFGAFLGVLIFDLGFVPPVLALTVYDVRYLITFAVFICVAVTTSTIAERLRQRIHETIRRETTIRALYDLSRELAVVRDTESLAATVANHIGRSLETEAAVFGPDPEGHLVVISATQNDSILITDSNERAVADWAYRHGEPAGIGTNTLPGSTGLYLPLRTEAEVLGVIGICAGNRVLSYEQKELLEAFAGLAAIANERYNLSLETQHMRYLEESEKLRNAIFNSIAHDMRTPLSTILGSVTSLLEDEEIFSIGERRLLLQTIKDGAHIMDRVVGNLLDMARLEENQLHLRLDWYDLQDVVGATLRQIGDQLRERKLSINIPEDLPMLKFDFTLVEEVIANLLDNAVKYSFPESKIDIFARLADKSIEVSVADNGIGIPPGEETAIFDKFYRVQVPEVINGIGLGLSICKGIIESHGGKIWAANQPGGGSIISFTLPLTDNPPLLAQSERAEKDD